MSKPGLFLRSLGAALLVLGLTASRVEAEGPVIARWSLVALMLESGGIIAFTNCGMERESRWLRDNGGEAHRDYLKFKLCNVDYLWGQPDPDEPIQYIYAPDTGYPYRSSACGPEDVYYSPEMSYLVALSPTQQTPRAVLSEKTFIVRDNRVVYPGYMCVLKSDGGVELTRMCDAPLSLRGLKERIDRIAQVLDLQPPRVKQRKIQMYFYDESTGDQGFAYPAE